MTRTRITLRTQSPAGHRSHVALEAHDVYGGREDVRLDLDIEQAEKLGRLLLRIAEGEFERVEYEEDLI